MTKNIYRDFATAEAVHAAYDTEHDVPDVMVYVDYWEKRSAYARSVLKSHCDIPYGPTRAEYLDWFPAEADKAPIVLFLHGGYWRVLSAKEFSFSALGPVAAGVALASVNYALCPAVSIDEICRQARASVAWSYRNASSLGGDRNRIFLCGHSAGAHLAVRCLETDWEDDYDLPADIIKGAMLISGLYDLRPIRYTNNQPLLQLDGDSIERNSPQLRPPPRSNAHLLFTDGSMESAEFRRQTADYFQSWVTAGNSAEYYEQTGRNHFDAGYGLEDKTSELCKKLLAMTQGKQRNSTPSEKGEDDSEFMGRAPWNDGFRNHGGRDA